MQSLKEILVVDDEAGIRFLLADALSDVGFKVTLARDGQESLEKMENRRFDLLVTDIEMPRVDGIELLRRMKKDGRQEKVIVMTGKSGETGLVEAEVQPVFTRLRKPFPMRMFLEVVTSALTRA